MKIGKYKLFLGDDGSILIINEDGEGGAFDKDVLFKKLEAVIDEFYKENF